MAGDAGADDVKPLLHFVLLHLILKYTVIPRDTLLVFGGEAAWRGSDWFEVGFSQDQLSCEVHHSSLMVAATVVEGLEEGHCCLQMLCVHAAVNQFTVLDVGVGLLALPVLMEHFSHVQGFHDPFTEKPVQNDLVGIPKDCKSLPLSAPCEYYC